MPILLHYRKHSYLVVIVQYRLSSICKLAVHELVCPQDVQYPVRLPAIFYCISFIKSIRCKKEGKWKVAHLPHRDHVTHYLSKFVLFHKVWKLERFKTAKVTFNGIGNDAIQ